MVDAFFHLLYHDNPQVSYSSLYFRFSLDSPACLRIEYWVFLGVKMRREKVGEKKSNEGDKREQIRLMSR